MILNTYKTRKIGKYVTIEGYVILSRAYILREVKKAEEAIKTKKGRKRKIIILSSLESKEEDSEDELA
jgi:hypothetical protein